MNLLSHYLAINQHPTKIIEEETQRRMKYAEPIWLKIFKMKMTRQIKSKIKFEIIIKRNFLLTNIRMTNSIEVVF